MSGMKRIKGICYVLDGFHIKKYVARLLVDEEEETKEVIKQVIETGSKKQVKELFMKLSVSQNQAKEQQKEEAKTYLLSNLTVIQFRLKKVEEL